MRVGHSRNEGMLVANIGLPGGNMAGIRWERDFDVAVEKGKSAGKPIFQDFWFDG